MISSTQINSKNAQESNSSDGVKDRISIIIPAYNEEAQVAYYY